MVIIKKTHFIFIKLTAVYLILIFFIVYSAVFAKNSISAAKEALSLCFSSVIPSLFPFFVFSSILICCGFAQFLGKTASPLMRPLFNVGGSGALGFITGILSGYPAGAKICSELYEKKLISRTEALRLLPFCNNSGPLFIIGSVGCTMFGSTSVGVFLYIIHVISALLVGICFRFFKKNESHEYGKKKSNENLNLNLGKIFSLSVQNSVQTILNICGFIVIFSCISESVCPIIDTFIKSSGLNLFLKGIFEVTLGIKGTAASNLTFNHKLILSSMLLGFGGICVHLQVAGIVTKNNLSIKTYLLGKSLHSVFSGFLCCILIYFNKVPVFSPKSMVSALPFIPTGYIFIAVILCIFFINKYNLNK